MVCVLVNFEGLGWSEGIDIFILYDAIVVPTLDLLEAFNSVYLLSCQVFELFERLSFRYAAHFVATLNSLCFSV